MRGELRSLKSITFRVTDDERLDISRRASESGKAVSVWIRELIFQGSVNLTTDVIKEPERGSATIDLVLPEVEAPAPSYDVGDPALLINIFEKEVEEMKKNVKPVVQEEKPKKAKKGEIFWRCLSCKASGSSLPGGERSAHFMESPKCKMANLSIG